MQSAADYIDDVLAPSSASGDERICDCIFCGKEAHMYVNVVTGLAHCFVCGEGGNLPQLIQQMEGLDWISAKYKAAMLLRGMQRGKTRSLDSFYAILNKAKEKSENKKIPLPTGCVPIKHVLAARARKYLKSRGFLPSHFKGLFFCQRPTQENDYRYKNHIIIPHYENGSLAFYTSRLAGESDRFPKSYNPPKELVLRRKFLLGENYLPEKTKTVILVEGPLDMLALRGFAVALLGSTMQNEQLEKLRTYSRVVVYLDQDARSNAYDIAYHLSRAGLRTHLRESKYDAADRVKSNPIPRDYARLILRKSREYSLGARIDQLKA